MLWTYQQFWMAAYCLLVILVPLLCRRLWWAQKLLVTVGSMALAASFLVLPTRDMQAIAIALLAAAVAFGAAGHLDRRA